MLASSNSLTCRGIKRAFLRHHHFTQLIGGQPPRNFRLACMLCTQAWNTDTYRCAAGSSRVSAPIKSAPVKWLTTSRSPFAGFAR